jgi:hypothetical protein
MHGRPLRRFLGIDGVRLRWVARFAKTIGCHDMPLNNKAQRMPASRLLVPRSRALIMCILVAVIWAAAPVASWADRWVQEFENHVAEPLRSSLRADNARFCSQRLE